MNAIMLKAVIDENRCLIVDIPDDFPTGPVTVTLASTVETADESQDITPEEADRRFRAAGVLDDDEPSPDAMEVSEE